MLLELAAGTETLLLDCLGTPTTAAILTALAITTMLETWGNDISCPALAITELETSATDVVQPGEILF